MTILACQRRVKSLYSRAPSALWHYAPVDDAQVAQLVEHATENRGVGGSNPPLGTTPLLAH